MLALIHNVGDEDASPVVLLIIVIGVVAVFGGTLRCCKGIGNSINFTWKGCMNLFPSRDYKFKLR
jgi:hypothetical protein